MAYTRAPQLSAAVLTVASVLFGNIVSCGSQTVTTLYKVGGTVTGLNGTLKLANNGGDVRTLTASGAFQFATGLKKGAAYAVTVAEAPTGQVCTVSDGQGTVGSEDVSSVAVTCSEAAYTLGGTVSGLKGSLVLANSTATVSVAAGATSFVFAEPLAQGATYAVTVMTQPTGQRCDITSGSGTIAGANVTSVAVSCADTHSVRVHVTNLMTDSVQLTDDTNERISITYDETSAATAYTGVFSRSVVAGDRYTVAVTKNPLGDGGYSTLEVCSFAANSNAELTGVVSDSDPVLEVQCKPSHTLNGTIERQSNATAVDISDGTNDIQSSTDSNAPTGVSGTFGYYPDGQSFTVTLQQGDGCAACPADGQTIVGTTVSGKFQGADITVTYVCGVSCPVVN